MSRRRGEFEHRTSIFEGAYRAWSHLGGLEPEDLERREPGTEAEVDDPGMTIYEPTGCDECTVRCPHRIDVRRRALEVARLEAVPRADGCRRNERGAVGLLR